MARGVRGLGPKLNALLRDLAALERRALPDVDFLALAAVTLR